MKKFTTSLFALLLVSAAFATEPAASVMAKAQATAQKSHRNVLVIFHASWCGWCKKFDEFLADKAMGKLMNDNFVIVHLDVLEQPDKKNLENEGADKLLAGWNGAQAGVPFMVVVDPAGKKLIDSNRTKELTSNIGYPARPEEIAHFMKMVETGSAMKAKDRAAVETWLKDHAPKE